MRARLNERYGPWAVVTGASEGIGRAFAVELAASGVNLLLVARREAALRALAEDLAATRGIEARWLAADLSRPEGAAAVLEAAAPLDVGLLVAAAGFGTSGPFVGASLADELEMIDLNCRAVVELAHGFAGRLAARGRGGLVLMGSLVGWQGAPNAANYAATKAFVQSLAEGLRVELKPLGVDVVASAPGPVRSGFADRARMTMGAAAAPRTVARATLEGLGRRGTVVPGPLAKLLTWSLATLPRSLRVSVMGAIMAGMTRTAPASRGSAGGG